MNKRLLLLIVILCAGFALTATPHDSFAASAPAAKTRKSPRQRRPYVPIDLKKMFTTGPLSDPQPPSTLLPAGATTVELTLRAAAPTVCRYSIGAPLPYSAMTPFDSTQPSNAPHTVIRGLNPDTTKINDLYIRCLADPEAVLHLQYRALPAVKPGFPRTANLWGSGNFTGKGMQYAARIDLWLGAHFTPEQILEIRKYNANVLILTSINTVENNDVPDDYFLRDVKGQKIEVWPGAYRLNLTRPEVAQYQAVYAYDAWLRSGMMVDGCFFDNFMMTMSWVKDIYGHKPDVDANGDGKPDDKKWFDTAWREGVFAELRAWRKLMPWALASGHSQGFPTPEIAEIYNGQGIGFYTTDVIEGKRSFNSLWDYYQAWCTRTVKPAITSVESAVPDQIAYGYDYSPQRHTPPSTWDFARDYYPYMRFGLAFTLMQDGYFMHELGDTHHGQDWWYDELDFKLGAPQGDAREVEVGQASHQNMLENGDFETALDKGWTFWFNKKDGYSASVESDRAAGRNGGVTARITIANTGAKSASTELTQPRHTLKAGQAYDFKFWAKANPPRKVTLSTSKGTPEWRNYGLREEVTPSGQWAEYSATFTATESASDARLQFIFGSESGEVWIDDVRLTEHADSVYRRDFAQGVALLNPTTKRLTFKVEDGLARLKGAQAPRYQYIIDDAEGGFSASGAWETLKLDTAEWLATPPFYHAWKGTCHKLAAGADEAKWDLALRGAGSYTLQAWWPAAPEAKDWTRQAVYEVVAGGRVVASKTFDESQTGDEWHTIAEGQKLSPEDRPFVRVKNGGSGPLVADAIHVFTAERYNDGLSVKEVSLEPMDGVILQRVGK